MVNQTVDSEKYLKEKLEEQASLEKELKERFGDINSDKNRVKYLEDKVDESYLLMNELEATRKFHKKIEEYTKMPFDHNSSAAGSNIVKDEESEIIGQILASSDY